MALCVIIESLGGSLKNNQKLGRLVLVLIVSLNANSNSFVASEVTSEVISEVELEDSAAVESEVGNELTLSTSEVEQVSSSEVEQMSSSEVEQAQVSQSNRASKYTGWKDFRINGNGVKEQYKNGIKVVSRVYSNNVLTEQYYYYQNQAVRVKRTYTYVSKENPNQKKREYRYDKNGQLTDYKRWNDRGYLELDYNYFSGYGRVSQVTSFYPNGQISDITKYTSPGIRADRKQYSSSGLKTSDYNYNKQGVQTYRFFFRDNGQLMIKQDFVMGNINSSTRYDLDGNREYYKLFYPNGQVKCRKLYYSANRIKQREYWDSAGNRTKLEKWDQNKLLTDIKIYYSNGKMSYNYDYDSYGNVKKLTKYNWSGSLSQVTTYATNGGIKLRNSYNDSGIIQKSTSYYASGKAYVDTLYDASGKKLSRRVYNGDGRIKREYPGYFSTGVETIKLEYTYHSNGVIATIKRSDYTARGEYTTITETYNQLGRQIKETIESPYALSYFKSPMKSGYITCQYACYSGHVGIDFGDVNKTVELYSTAPGVVVQATGGCSANGGYLGNNCNYGAGNYVVIQHQYNNKQYYSIYMHLSTINVKAGQNVTSSTVIGKMGLSGNTSGPHLHFELFEDTDYDGYRYDEYRSNPAILVDLSKQEIKLY